jgi:hypothetical protein
MGLVGGFSQRCGSTTGVLDVTPPHPIQKVVTPTVRSNRLAFLERESASSEKLRVRWVFRALAVFTVPVCIVLRSPVPAVFGASVFMLSFDRVWALLQRRKFRASDSLQPVTVRVDERGVSVTSDANPAVIPWPDLRAWSARPRSIVLAGEMPADLIVLLRDWFDSDEWNAAQTWARSTVGDPCRHV